MSALLPPSRRSLLAGGLAATLGLTAGKPGRTRAATAPVEPRRAPAALVIGHRGACALRPEHTLASYAKAIADGADLVEPDLVPTRDGILVARHECDITATTDVARRPEFAARRTTRTIDNRTSTGWFTVDFTLAELKTLRARERLPQTRPRNTEYDGMFQIPTFEEILDFVAAEAATRGRVVGLIPELKSTPFFRSIGLPTEERLVRLLADHAYGRIAPVEIQCFFGDSLRQVRAMIGRGHGNPRLMQLLDLASAPLPGRTGNTGFADFAAMMAPAGLAAIAGYADVIGPNSRSVIPLDTAGRLGAPTALVRDAHAAGLLVQPYTFRPENRFLAAEFRDGAGDDARNPEGSVAEIGRYLDAGIDGFFTDDPALGRRAVDRN